MGDDDDEQQADAGGMNVTKYPVMPSLVSLQQMRNRLHLAFLGRKLMKWTALATSKELRRLAQEMGAFLAAYREEVRDAYMLLARCRYFMDNMNLIVLETMPRTAVITVKSASRSVSGVKVKSLNVVEAGITGYQFLGVGRGGDAVKTAREAWLELIKKMVFICSLRISFDMIDVANKNATKKQNVLQRNIIPRIAITMRYILSELDEQEREESFRLKRFKQLKYKDVKDEKKEKEAEPPVPPTYQPRPPPVPPPPVLPPPVPSPPVLPPPVPPPPVPPPPVPPPPVLPPPVPPPPVPPPPVPPPPVPPPPVLPAPVPPRPILRPPQPPLVPPTPVIPPPPVVEPLDPLEVLILHITNGLKLVEEVEKAAIPAQVSGLTKCDLVRLKTELREVIKRREAPDKDKIEGDCSCPKEEDGPVSSTANEKPDGFQAAQELMPQHKAPPTKIPEYILKPHPTAQKLSEADRLQQLEENVEQVICMTNYYQGEGLLSRSAEDFLKCCRAVKCKIQEYRGQKKVKAKLDHLKEQVSKLEKITDIVQKEELSTTTISSFKTCCQEFRDKIELRKSCKGAPSVHSIEKLINQIGDSIALSNEAKKEGLVSESVEDFIMSCKEIKSKIVPRSETKPRVIDDLLYNINDITDFISKYKDDGLMSESIERFYLTCQATKEKLDNYEPPPIETRCSKSTCPKNKDLTKPVTNMCKVLDTTLGEDDEVTAQTAIKTQDVKKKKHDKQQLQYSDELEEHKVTLAEPSIERSAELQPQACSDSTCSHKAEKLQSRRSCKLHSSKESKEPCLECNNKTAKPQLPRSSKSKSSHGSKSKCAKHDCSKKTESQSSYKNKSSTQDCEQICPNSECSVKKCPSCVSKACKKIKSLCPEYVCLHNKSIQPESQHPYKSDPNLASALEPIDSKCSQYTAPKKPSKQPCKSCSAIVAPNEGKDKKDPNGGKCCKSVAPEKSKDLCTRKSKSNVSSNIAEIYDGKNEHDPKGRKCGKLKSSETSDSCKNLSAANKSESTRSGKTTKTVKRFKNKDGSVIEITETVVVKKRKIDPEDIMSDTPSHATGSCHSVQSTKTVHVCEVPVTRGFIQTVRNVKSETLIRTQNLSHPYPPFVWSCVSADTLAFGGESIGTETVQQDPFFCDTPTDNGSGSVFHM